MNEESIGCHLFVQRAGILERLIKVWDMQGISFLERDRVKQKERGIAWLASISHCQILKGPKRVGLRKGSVFYMDLEMNQREFAL